MELFDFKEYFLFHKFKSTHRFSSIIFYLDREYRIIKFNSETEYINGLRRKDVLGKNFLEMFVPVRNREQILKDINKVLVRGQACAFENFVKDRQRHSNLAPAMSIQMARWIRA